MVACEKGHAIFGGGSGRWGTLRSEVKEEAKPEDMSGAGVPLWPDHAPTHARRCKPNQESPHCAKGCSGSTLLSTLLGYS